MSAITVTDPVLSFLRQISGPAEIRDASGHLVGFFTPRSVAAPSRVEPGKTYTTLEVFEHLLTLTDDPQRRADVQRHLDEIKRRRQCAGQ